MSDKRKNDEIPCSEKLQAVGYTQSPMHFRMEQKKKKKKKKKNWLEIRQGVKINVENVSGLSCSKRYICQGK